MDMLLVVLVSAVVLAVAYRLYGGFLARKLQLNSDTPTPAVAMRDDVDYAPIEPKFLLSQHFSAIAAAGPIVGPILAAHMFGWAPALLWIVLGSIFIGGVHDMAALVASVRHKARSIAEVVREHMSRRAYVLFLLFIWIALVYIIVAFTDIVADSFVGTQKLADGATTTGGAVATASLLYLVLPLIMGLLLRYTKLSLNWATAIFLPLIAVAVWLGQYLPLNLDQALGISEASAHKLWDVLLLVYCFAASIVPMWLLLQPRGHLGGYFLLIILGGGVAGLLIAAFTGQASIQYPAFRGWEFVNAQGAAAPLMPMLFITIACGACSGFHAIIASGTTCKQLRHETDAKAIGYGSMLLEAMVAVLSVCCVMMLAKDSPLVAGAANANAIYANGIGTFFHALGVPLMFAFMFVLLAFTTFVYDTLDVCTRLGRYILQELTGIQGKAGRVLATIATAGAPLVFLLSTPAEAKAWRTFWNLFGASNQLLAALTLLGVTVWLWRKYGKAWVFVVAGLPTVFMYAMSAWALARFIRTGFTGANGQVNWLPSNPVPWAALILLALALLVLVEAILVFILPPRRPDEPEGEAATVAA